MIKAVRIEYEIPIDLLAALHKAHGSLLDEGGCIITMALWNSVQRMDRLREAFAQGITEEEDSESHPAGHEEPADNDNQQLKG